MDEHYQAENIDVDEALTLIADALVPDDPSAPISPEHPLGVAYSGGVDSAALVSASARILGAESVLAILGVSPSLARREHRAALDTASQIGVRVVEVPTHEIDDAHYRANGVDRCYFCKTELFTQVDAASIEHLHLACLAYGENADDALRPDRPGARAATERRVLRPLATAGLTKSDVRALAYALGVPVADKPAAPCLASRIPHGEPVTPEKLRQIDQAEDAVFAAGFSDARVRHHGVIARIEVPASEFALLADDAVRENLITDVKAAGFTHVTLDLAGIQSGAFTLSLLQVGLRA